jgi:peptidoglycan hydrolase-like protein with peptidoglycan-binding domain
MSTVLHQGSHGAEVLHLQQLLHQHGYYGGAVNGEFDERTQVAVIAYQRDAGLHVDGSVDGDTWRSLDGTAGPQTGLRDAAHVDDYVHSAYGVMHSSMTPQDRLEDLMGAAIQELTELGVPQPTYGFDAALSGTSTQAEFRPNRWHVAVNPDLFQPAYLDRLTERQLGDVAKTIYHESRHAELTFREARAQAGLGQHAGQLAAGMRIPRNIADEAVAHAVYQSTMDGATDEALTGYDSFYGAGAARMHSVYAHGTYSEYRQLPEESDAFEAGHNVAEHWRHYGGARGPIQHGDHGEDVRYLQRALAHLGYYHGIDDGDFGPNTVAAVQRFQEHYALPADGLCEEKSWESLGRVYSE